MTVPTRILRIGHQLSARIDGSPVAAAVRAEQLGFDIVLASDHLGPGWAPLPTLSAGISYFAVRELDDFEPVLRTLR